jgi:hypothetical protein
MSHQRCIGFMIIVAMGLALTCPSASAVTVTFQLENVTLACVTCPQEATGSFTIDLATYAVLSADINTTGPDPGEGLFSVPPKYTAGTFTNTGGNQYFGFSNGGFSSLIIQILPHASLSLTTPNQIFEGSGEYDPNNFSWGRVVNGQFEVVPTPIVGAGLPGVITVLAGGGLLARWRRKRNAEPVAV